MAPNNLVRSFSCFFTIFAFAAVFQFLSATSSAAGPREGDGHFCYENCLRRAFALSPALPPSRNNGGVITRSLFCKDEGRAIMTTVKLTGKLPRRYLRALCNVLKDEGKVEAYVKDTFWGQDTNRLLDGQSCKTVTAGKPDLCSTG